MGTSAIRASLVEELPRTFRGEVRTGPVDRAFFSTDASLFRIEPLAIASPLDEADVQSLVHYAAERGIALIGRGAGTGLAGESLGTGIIVDFARHFREIVEIGDESVRVQPGVVLKHLNESLARFGRRIAIDSSSASSCTIGGMIANNASGSRAIAHGTMREHVQHLRVVWDDGSADAVGAAAPDDRGPSVPRTVEIHDHVESILRQNQELIESAQVRTRFDRCGYRLHDSITSHGLDLSRLLVGSEGTLGLVTEATLRTVAIPGGRTAVAIGAPSLESALQIVELARPYSPTACELLDRRLLSLARASSSDAASMVPVETEAALLIEFERATPAEARDAARELVEVVQRHPHLIAFVVTALDTRRAEELWVMRDLAVQSLYAINRGPRPLAFVEDIGVPPEQVGKFLTIAKSILQRFEVTWSCIAHAATGQVHVRPFLDPDSPDDAAKLWPLAEELHGLAIQMGGTISSQHGLGLARTPWVERQVGPLWPVHREIKRAFDPRDILNPGKIVGPDPSRPAWPLQPSLSARKLEPLLVWQPEELTQTISSCNGCGTCRTEAFPQRMCPVFRAKPDESATPRAKVQLLRAVLDGQANFGDDAVRSAAELCVNCKMCVSECPSKVDVPRLMLEAKAANHAARGLTRSAWFLARIDGLASLASKFSITSNFLLARPTIRWALEKTFGLSRHRTLPALSFRTFLGRARRRGWTKRPDTDHAIAYFVDSYANLCDPSLAEATVAVLRHNGAPVYVPARQTGTGAAALAQGDADVARDRLGRNLKVLADCVRRGDTIVCSEPTAALFFRMDALGLTTDPDAQLVAENTVELSSYLWSLHLQGQLKTNFRSTPLSIGHHVPCHIKAIGTGAAGPRLLGLIPELTVNKIDRGCSGMAGAWGLNVKNFPVSLSAGSAMLTELSQAELTYGSSECSSCRLQMQEGTGKRALHPVQYLAMAYGLMPSFADRLRRPIRRRVSS